MNLAHCQVCSYAVSVSVFAHQLLLTTLRYFTDTQSFTFCPIESHRHFRCIKDKTFDHPLKMYRHNNKLRFGKEFGQSNDF